MAFTVPICAGHNENAVAYFYTSAHNHNEVVYEAQHSGKNIWTPMACIKNYSLPINSITVEFEFDTSFFRLEGKSVYGNQYGFHTMSFGEKSMTVTGDAVMTDNGIMCFTPTFEDLIDLTGVPHTLSIKHAVITSTNPPSEDVIKSSAVFLYNGATLDDIPNDENDTAPPPPPPADYIDPIPGDVDWDGDVDIADFLILSDNWGKIGPIPTPLSERHQIVRDTITIYQTIEAPLKLPHPDIRIEGDGWRLPTHVLQATLEDVQGVFIANLMYPYDSDVAVRHDLDGPILRGHRAPDGAYIVGLDVHSEAQTVFQFAHEYTHIISGKRPTVERSKQLWLEEVIAMVGSHFALKQLSKKTPYFELYYQQDISDVQVPQNLGVWHQTNKALLEQNFWGWAHIREAAVVLLPIFEQHPKEAWNAVRYKDRGVDIYEEFFELYMNEWYRRTPPQWQFVVGKIIDQFGIARTSKPAKPATLTPEHPELLTSPKGND